VTTALAYQPPEMPPDERRLLEAAAVWDQPLSGGRIRATDFARLTSARGIDFATAALYDRVRRDPGTALLMQGHFSPANGAASRPPRDALLAVVPGALYREYPKTGADGRVIRNIAESIGWTTELIRLPTDGPPEPNGERLQEWLDRRANRPTLLVSLSKGSADVKAALGMGADAFRSVIGWISFGGILDGSPMAAWVLQRRLARWMFRGLFRCTGHDFRMMTELHYKSSEPCAPLRLPEHFPTLHVAGFPLRRHLGSARARRWHKRLSVWGPNDSVTVLADAASWSGTVWPVWGTDHYLQSRWQPERLIPHLLCCVVQHTVGHIPSLVRQ
jgi:hypothetical protein